MMVTVSPLEALLGLTVTEPFLTAEIDTALPEDPDEPEELLPDPELSKRTVIPFACAYA